METTPEIRFRGMDPSPAVEAAVHERIERLERFHDRITSCTVVIEAPHKHSWKGKIYHVRIDIAVPGAEIVVGREPEENQAHEDVHVAIRDQFDAARRQLEDVVRKMSGHRAKSPPEKLHGSVARLNPEEAFGFIETPDRREFFFSRDSVTTDAQWDRLEVGTQVRFSEHEGDKGPMPPPSQSSEAAARAARWEHFPHGTHVGAGLQADQGGRFQAGTSVTSGAGPHSTTPITGCGGLR